MRIVVAAAVRGCGPGDAEVLQAFLTQICQPETALACHRILAPMESYVTDCP